MQQPQKLELTIRRSDKPWRQRFDVPPVNGQPLDMRAHSALMQVRLYRGQPGLPCMAVDVPVYTGFIDSQGNILTFSGGERFVTSSSPFGSSIQMGIGGFDVTINNGDIGLLPVAVLDEVPLNLVYDIIVREPSGDQRAWFEGSCCVLPGVTEPFSQADRQEYFSAVASVAFPSGGALVD